MIPGDCTGERANAKRAPRPARPAPEALRHRPEEENRRGRKRPRGAEEAGDQVAPLEEEAGQGQAEGRADQEEVMLAAGRCCLDISPTKMGLPLSWGDFPPPLRRGGTVRTCRTVPGGWRCEARCSRTPRRCGPSPPPPRCP